MSTTLRKAEQEFDLLGSAADEPGRKLVEDLLLTMVQGQDMDSETAREWVLDIFGRLARHQVLTPLTGESWEWNSIPAEQQFNGYNLQNSRESSIVAVGGWMNPGQPNQTFYIEKAVDLFGLQWARGDNEPQLAWQPIGFPYMPQRFAITINADDPRTDEAILDEAREHFRTQQVTFVKAERTDQD